ncbi:protein-S-isoprenylcysteine O-methyltransferase Ste14 [Arthrobacter woluwensis]|nr:protein-S-isoprenylcysteine O-methyltransferase Ste14 [Arthrobacter woluwensis]
MVRRPGPWERRAREDALSRGLTREEYGVYKGDFGTPIKPVTSVGGLLIIAVACTILSVVVIFAVVMSIVAPGSSPGSRFQPSLILCVLITVAVTATAWGYFLKEHQASRLRRSRGKSLSSLRSEPQDQPMNVGPHVLPGTPPTRARRPSPAGLILGGALLVIGGGLGIVVLVRSLTILLGGDTLELLWTGLWLAALACFLMLAGIAGIRRARDRTAAFRRENR